MGTESLPKEGETQAALAPSSGLRTRHPLEKPTQNSNRFVSVGTVASETQTAKTTAQYTPPAQAPKLPQKNTHTGTAMILGKPSFKTLFCEQFRCPPSDYEEQAFLRFLYWHARLLAPIVRLLNPSFFTHDFAFVQYLGGATSSRDVNAEMMAFQDTIHGNSSFMRTGLRIRVSGRKAAGLAQELLEAERRMDVPAADGTT